MPCLRRGLGILSARIRVALRVEHQDVDVLPRGQHVVQAAEADVVGPAVAADDPMGGRHQQVAAALHRGQRCRGRRRLLLLLQQGLQRALQRLGKRLMDIKEGWRTVVESSSMIDIMFVLYMIFIYCYYYLLLIAYYYYHYYCYLWNLSSTFLWVGPVLPGFFFLAARITGFCRGKKWVFPYVTVSIGLHMLQYCRHGPCG